MRATLEHDGPALGAWLQMPNPSAAEAVGRLGFDWVRTDTQHGMVGYEATLSMLQAIAVSGRRRSCAWRRTIRVRSDAP